MQQNNLSREYLDSKLDLRLNLKRDLHVTFRKPGSGSFKGLNALNGRATKKINQLWVPN